MSDEAARAAHAAVGEIATQRRLDPVLCQQWDVCASCRELSHGVAAAVLAADPDRAALVRENEELRVAVCVAWAKLGPPTETVDCAVIRKEHADTRAYLGPFVEAIEGSDHPHLLDAARGQEGQHGA